jgi:hypothetical protein
MATIPNEEQLKTAVSPDAVPEIPLVHGTIRARRTGGEEWLVFAFWVA